MRDVMELLRAKEQELLKVKRQVEALRIAAPLLAEQDQVPPCKRGWGDERSESSVIPLLRDVESAYVAMSFTCVAIYQVLPNGSVTAEVRSP
jgi:hypothetical protein